MTDDTLERDLEGILGLPTDAAEARVPRKRSHAGMRPSGVFSEDTFMEDAFMEPQDEDEDED